jgi:integrase/recombinase XerD
VLRKRRSNQIKKPVAFKVDETFRDDILSYDEAVLIFIKDGKIKNLSPHTLKYYENELGVFKKILTALELPTEPIKLTKTMIKEQAIVYMTNELELKITTVNTRLRAVRALFNYLYKEKYIANNPVKDLSLLKQKKTVIATFSKEQIMRLLQQPDLSTFTGFRDYTIMLLLLETGIRAKEIVGISVHDINFGDSSIIIRDGKGYKERLVPIQRDMQKQLKKYLDVRGQAEDDALFLTIDNTMLTKRQLQQRIKDYGNSAGIKTVRCSPHTFRHTFAKMCVKGGAGIFELQQILGHTSMEMVRNYVNLFSDDVKDKHREFSPLNQLKKR